MLGVFTFLHYMGLAFLAGGEPLVAMMAIKAEKDDLALKFFVSFLWNIVIFMWVGMILAAVGGFGIYFSTNMSLSILLKVKLVLYILVAIVSLILLINVPKVKKAAAEDFSKLRSNAKFKMMDLLSKIDMILILAIVIVSVNAF